MKRKQIKFVVGSLAIVLTLTYLGYSGFNESLAYYQTVPEVYAEKERFYDKRLKVSGDVIPGSIVREGVTMKFMIAADPKQPKEVLQVHYVGKDPLPDTFREYATAIVDGKYSRDGVFTATAMQAKCASKYAKEAEAGVTPAKSEF